jgi:hypothetical protein
MKLNTLAGHYHTLTPDERFALVFRAGARGDGAEQARLVAAGGLITLVMEDHAPFAHAFDWLALRSYVELLAEASAYLEALQFADDADGLDDAAPEDASDEGAPGDEGDTEGAEPSAADRRFDLAMAMGYVLKIRAAAWRLFCDRSSFPPFAAWEGLPGLDRLRRALAVAESAAFAPEGFLRWANAARPKGSPEVTEIPLSVEGLADAMEGLFRERVKWWCG